MIAIGPRLVAEIHRHAVLHDSVLLEDLVEHVQRPPGVAHVVFGNDFKPSDDRLAREDVLVMLHAQPDADAEVGEGGEAGAGHEGGFSIFDFGIFDWRAESAFAIKSQVAFKSAYH